MSTVSCPWYVLNKRQPFLDCILWSPLTESNYMQWVFPEFLPKGTGPGHGVNEAELPPMRPQAVGETVSHLCCEDTAHLTDRHNTGLLNGIQLMCSQVHREYSNTMGKNVGNTLRVLQSAMEIENKISSVLE